MSIEIREHTPGRDVAEFIRAGFEVFKFDPTWVPPLNFEFKERLSPKTNPFFNRAEVTLFTAWKDGQLVGRCSASIDREYLRITGPGWLALIFHDLLSGGWFLERIYD